ncbi:hypothetical protein Q7P37_003734 [Cladosporium fusiforme]
MPVQELRERPQARVAPVVPHYHQYPISYESPHSQAALNYHKMSSSRRSVAAPPSAKKKRRASSSNVSVVDLTADSPQSTAPTPKRKRAPVNDHEYDETSVPLPSSKRSRKKEQTTADSLETPNKKQAKKAEPGEKRMRRFRPKAPQAYLTIRERALTQRLYVVDRQRCTDNESPSETVTLVGTTGNIYTVVVDLIPSCDCPYAQKGNQCKHIAYVLSRVLRAPAHLEYQLALVADELREIFQNAPPLPSDTAEDDPKDGSRKPIEGDCPICCIEFEPSGKEKIVWCKAACGNNIHEECFNQWRTTKGGGNVPCPFCRTPWQHGNDERQLKQVASTGSRNEEGYVNVASHLGLSGRRDYSTYNSYWVRQQARRGNIALDDDGVMDHEY